MRVAYSAVAHFLLQWTDCKLAGALGLLKVMLYKVCADGSSALPDWDMEASIREFYGVIFPLLLQLPSGITELDDRKQRKLCLKKFRSRDEQLWEVDTERELECGICLEEMTPTLLRSLKPQDMSVIKQVQVSRKWEFHGNTDIGSILHIDMILADKEMVCLYISIHFTAALSEVRGQVEAKMSKEDVLKVQVLDST
ncbi:RING/U-box superfamily protein [Zea mays]|uniref:RING/U-box superfamily protein n=1 Tax=Zea mays TaxID=4577 RepID=A0A1D6EL27_MAIZE|nr:RING/U-box superfamily protein [Zea mays]